MTSGRHTDEVTDGVGHEVGHEVRVRLRQLAAGELPPADAAAWASRLMLSAEDAEFDEPTWQALDQLAGADLLVGPGQPLHGPADFAAWSARFEGG